MKTRTRTTLTERNLRAATVADYLRKHGPADSFAISAGTGMDLRAVIGALTGLRRDGEVDQKKEPRGKPARFVWWLVDRLKKPRKPKPAGSGITAEDLEWMQYWRNHTANRAETRKEV